MDTKTIFSIESARSSVIDLADKCKTLRGMRNELKTRRRAGEEDPRIIWDAGTPKEKALRAWEIEEKKAYRGQCSRYHQLAYAFLRGVPYRVLEATARTNPLYELVDVLNKHLTEEGRAMLSGGKWYGSALKDETKAAVTAWLARDPAHLQCERGLRKLDALDRRGLNDSEEADKLRDALDAPWETMDEHQRAWVQRRSDRMDRQRKARQARQKASGPRARREAAA